MRLESPQSLEVWDEGRKSEPAGNKGHNLHPGTQPCAKPRCKGSSPRINQLYKAKHGGRQEVFISLGVGINLQNLYVYTYLFIFPLQHSFESPRVYSFATVLYA